MNTGIGLIIILIAGMIINIGVVLWGHYHIRKLNERCQKKVFKVWIFPEQIETLKSWKQRYTKPYDPLYTDERPYTITITEGHKRRIK